MIMKLHNYLQRILLTCFGSLFSQQRRDISSVFTSSKTICQESLYCGVVDPFGFIKAPLYFNAYSVNHLVPPRLSRASNAFTARAVKD